jgi:hypothetical protein
MIAELRLAGLLWLRTRAALLPTAALLFAIVGVYAQPENEIWSSYAFTALLLALLAAVFVIALAAAEPSSQRQFFLSLGPPSVTRGRRFAAYSAVAVVLAVVAAVLPAILGAFSVAPSPSDVLVATLVHVACALLGVSAGSAVASPVVRRPAIGIVLVLAYTLLEVALTPVVPALGGPMWIVERLLGHHQIAVSYVVPPLLGVVVQIVALGAVATALPPRRETAT